ncbi:MAG: hypothetical protein MUE60_00215 [Candidatus Eisenbacteria bacterium]|jgi:TolB-like protein|nr:hypothetical protein [Candidatus Eisenbacteria bacterium]
MRRPFVPCLALAALSAWQAPASAADTPQTLAVVDFLNNSLTDRTTYDPLSQGFSAALATQLSQVHDLEIVERSRIRQVAEELGLQASGAVDDQTAGRIGRIVGARYLLLGSFMVMGKKVRIDARMVETETTRLVKAEQVTGKMGDLLDLIGRLAEAFADRLGKKLERPSAAGISETAFSHYGMGIRLEDAGDLDMARREYAEALKTDPGFSVARDALARMEIRIQTEARVSLVRATGRHDTDAGRDAAREAATDDALRAAVRRSTGRLMGQDSLSFHVASIRDDVLPRSREYVRDFTVTGERDSAGTVIVEIAAQVARGVLEDDLIALGVLHPAWAHPRVMIVAEEDATGAEYGIPGGGREPTYSETRLQGMLTDRGFRVIDVGQYRRTLQARSPGLPSEDLTAYVLTQGGDLLVIGRVALSGGGAIGSYGIENIRSSTAEGSFQILRADNGQVIGTVSGSGVGADPQAVQSGLVAIQEMCKKVGTELERELVRLAREEVYGRRIVAFEVTGVRSQTDLTTIERVVRESVDGVLTVVPRSRDKELARFEISFEGHPSELAREINRVPFGNLRVIVEESSLGLIRARIER